MRGLARSRIGRDPGARAPVDVLAVDRLADGDGQGRCGALGGWGSVDVRFGRGVRADFHRPEPDERPALHPGHPGDGERGPGPARCEADHPRAPG
jgi:hypothetical protein